MAGSNSQMDNYRKMRRRRGRLVTIVIVSLFSIAVLIGAVSYYGDHVGNFVISVEKDSRVSLSLSETYEFLDPRDVLMPVGVTNQTNTSFYFLPFEQLNTNAGGEHSDTRFHEFFAYTFYLKNTSKNGQIIDYNIEMSLRTTTRKVDEAIRIMLVRNRDMDNIDQNRWIFAKPDKDLETGNRLTESGVNRTYSHTGAYYDSTLFASDSQIAAIPILALPPGEITTYTIVIWLEGDDPDCTDAIKGGMVMLDMQFTLVNVHES